MPSFSPTVTLGTALSPPSQCLTLQYHSYCDSYLCPPPRPQPASFPSAGFHMLLALESESTLGTTAFPPFHPMVISMTSLLRPRTSVVDTIPAPSCAVLPSSRIPLHLPLRKFSPLLNTPSVPVSNLRNTFYFNPQTRITDVSWGQTRWAWVAAHPHPPALSSDPSGVHLLLGWTPTQTHKHTTESMKSWQSFSDASGRLERN